MTPTSILFNKEVGHSQEGSQEVNKLLEAGVFDGPKPVRLLMRLLTLANLDDNSIVLDFFSGSASMGHALMKYNAENEKHCKFVLVQLPEVTDDKVRKAGYNNICEIGKERIRRAGRKVKEEAGVMGQDLDIGFRVLKLDSSNMEDVYYTPDNFDGVNLFTLVDNVKQNRTSEDLLFQVMLDLGIELSATIRSEELGGRNVWNVDNGYLMACFDRDVNEATITEIAKQKPVYFVMRDASAANDNVLDNFDQLFANYSPDTTCKIL